KKFDKCTRDNLTTNANCSTNNTKRKTTEQLNAHDANTLKYKKERRDLEFKKYLGRIAVDSSEKYNSTLKNWDKQPKIATNFVGEDIYMTHKDIISIFGKKHRRMGKRHYHKRKTDDISGYSNIIKNMLRYIPYTALSKVLTKGTDGKIYLTTNGVKLIQKFDEKAEYTMNQSTAELTAHIKSLLITDPNLNFTPEEKRQINIIADADLSGKLVDGNATNTHVEGVKFLGMTVGQEVKETYNTVRNRPITDIAKALEPHISGIFQDASTWGNDAQTTQEYNLVRNFFIHSEKAILDGEHDKNNWFTNWTTDNALDYEGSLQEAKLISRGVARFLQTVDINSGEDIVTSMVAFGKKLAKLTNDAKKLNTENKEVGIVNELSAMHLATMQQATTGLLSPINSPCTADFVAEVKKNNWEVNVVVENLFTTGKHNRPKDTTVTTRFDEQTTRSTEYGEWEETSRQVLSQNEVFRGMNPTVLSTVVNSVIGNPYTISDTSTDIKSDINYENSSSVIGTTTDRVLEGITTIRREETTFGDKNLVGTVITNEQGETHIT
ncbi:TPA: hypothetical protein EYG96_02840, partial [Candidatus Gracilibacteria bacterium]|nr:hypothetical protein [Candidatus Gracilibacteria bacterium]